MTDRKGSSKEKNGKERGRHMEQKQKKKGTPPPRYDEAFKAGAVRIVTEQRGAKEVARDIGVCIDTLRSWLKGAGMQMGQVGRHNRDRQRIRELEAELRSLRK